MKLHTKLILALLGALLVVVAGAQILQYRSATLRVARLSSNDIERLHERELEHARNVHRSIEAAVAGSLERGEMEKFSRILEQQRSVQGLLEFSLFDRAGKVSHSSDQANVGRGIAPDVFDSLRKKHEALTREGEEAIEIYQPQVVSPDCVRCHNEWKPGELGGVTYFRFSTKALADAERAANTEIASVRSSNLVQSVLVMLVIVAVVIVVMYGLLRHFVRKPLGLFVDLLFQFESDDGDLTRRIPIETRDEIGTLARLFNAFIARLNGVIGQAQETASAVGDQATGQAAAVEETSASVNELAEAARSSASNAEDARNAMREVQRRIVEANDAMTALSAAMGELSERSAETARIVHTIDEIASKTNLLSLNAAVEAARAGDAGAGFAVVAEEVRRLAAQAAEAARNTGNLIEATVARIEESSALVRKTDGTVAQVAQGSAHATELVEAIAQAAAAQSESIQQISGTLAQMDETTRRNADEAASLAETMAMFKTAKAE